MVLNIMPELNTPTLQAFVTPASFIFETARWVVALRPQQVTLGCVVLISKSDVTSMAELSAEDTTDLYVAWSKIGTMFDTTLQPEQLNYLALMMVDPNPHFHVLPRYAASRAFDGAMYADTGWPKLPDMPHAIDLSDDKRAKLVELLRKAVH